MSCYCGHENCIACTPPAPTPSHLLARHAYANRVRNQPRSEYDEHMADQAMARLKVPAPTTTPRDTEPELAERGKIIDWLKSKNYTVWSRGFNIKDEAGVEQAAEWAAKEFTDMLAFLDADD